MAMYASFRRLVLLALVITAGTIGGLLAQSGSDAVHRDLQAHFASHVEPLHTGATRFTFAVASDIHLSQGSTFVLTKSQ